MAQQNKYPGIDPRIVRIVSLKVGKLVGRHGITAADVPDIEQDMHLAVWSALITLHGIPLEAAVNQIVENKIRKLIRWRKRKRRDWRCVAFSIDEPAPNAEDPDDEIAHILDLEDFMAKAFGLPPTWHKQRAETADVADDLANLPDEIRDLANTLVACGGSLNAAAELMGVGRKKARLLLERLQKAFG